MFLPEDQRDYQTISPAFKSHSDIALEYHSLFSTTNWNHHFTPYATMTSIKPSIQKTPIRAKEKKQKEFSHHFYQIHDLITLKKLTPLLFTYSHPPPPSQTSFSLLHLTFLPAVERAPLTIAAISLWHAEQLIHVL